MARAAPTGVNKASYTPSNTALQPCPTIGSLWLAASSPLPPTPDAVLCRCMNSTAECVVSDAVLPGSAYADLFSSLCLSTDCSGIAHNGTTGEYGAYSMCTPEEQLNFLLGNYYVENHKQSGACNFHGSARIQTAPSSLSETCSSMLNQAGADGTRSVHFTPTIVPSATTTDAAIHGGSHPSLTSPQTQVHALASSSGAASPSPSKKSRAASTVHWTSSLCLYMASAVLAAILTVG